MTKRLSGGLRGVAYAPSVVPDQRFHTMPRAMPVALIEEIIAEAGKAARRFGEAGFDGIELLASHGLLISDFLNPRNNQRTDAYGGSFENRLRFLRELLAAVRNGLGDGPVLGMRISAEEVEPGGLDKDEVIAVCQALKAKRAIDYVNTTYGSMQGLGGSVHVVPPMEIAHAYVAPKAGTLRAAVGLPVFVAGRINQPQIAEHVLAAGQADMCGMTRAMICDPEMPNKARAGPHRRHPRLHRLQPGLHRALSTWAVRSPASSIRRPGASCTLRQHRKVCRRRGASWSPAAGRPA